jgi:hypothetical protein
VPQYLSKHDITSARTALDELGRRIEWVHSYVTRVGSIVSTALRTRRSSRRQSRGPMLELRPTCENCNKVLPPDSLEARICSYECTFCTSCADGVLGNVCPNCGGGFVPRPIRPSKNWKGDNFLGKDPASSNVRHRPVDPVVHAQFAAKIRSLPAEER